MTQDENYTNNDFIEGETARARLEALWECAVERAYEFDNLDKWNLQVVRKTDTVTTNWYQFVLTHGDKTVVIDAERIMYDEGFAKALFGNGPDCAYCGAPTHNQHQPECVEGSNIWPHLWEYHLQQAVISEDPIDYMYKVVFGE